MQERVIADKVTSILMIQILIKTNQYKCYTQSISQTHGTVGWTVIHVSVRGTGGHSVECPTIPWDHGMGWTVGHVHL